MPDNEDDEDLRDSLTRFEEFVTDVGEDIEPEDEDEDVDAAAS